MTLRPWPGCYTSHLGTYPQPLGALPLRGNWGVSPWAILLLGLATLGAAPNDYLSAKQKFDSIESGRLKAGSRVELSIRELDAYAEHEVPERCAKSAPPVAGSRGGDGRRHGGFR
jgi:hypothetical protein